MEVIESAHTFDAINLHGVAYTGSPGVHVTPAVNIKRVFLKVG